MHPVHAGLRVSRAPRDAAPWQAGYACICDEDGVYEGELERVVERKLGCDAEAAGDEE